MDWLGELAGDCRVEELLELFELLELLELFESLELLELFDELDDLDDLEEELDEPVAEPKTCPMSPLSHHLGPLSPNCRMTRSCLMTFPSP